MRLNTSIVVAAATLAGGLIWREPHLWVPASVLMAGLVWLALGGWAALGKRGANAGASEVPRLTVNLVGLYATLGQVACIVLAVW